MSIIIEYNVCEGNCQKMIVLYMTFIHDNKTHGSHLHYFHMHILWS